MNRRSLLRSMLALPFLGLRGTSVPPAAAGNTFEECTFVVGGEPWDDAFPQYRFTMGIHPAHGFSPSAYKFFQLKDLPPCTNATPSATRP